MTGTDVDETIGSVLAGRFRVTALLGRGGMASVYLADDEELGRTVAIKVFRRDLADGDDLQRQREEMKLLAGLNHPGLVTLFDASVDDSGNMFLVMELVSGTDLHSRLSKGPLPSTEVAEIGSHVAGALAYVHGQGVIHRDIKPGNILLPSEHSVGPSAKLADFGIARLVDGSRLTATGTVLGTASYFSPEQALGEGITTASDIYSLGLVLLECLTGEKAFPGTAAESMVARLGRDPDVPAELGDAWAGLLRGMTARSPDARPTARDVAGVLARLAEVPTVTRPYPASEAPSVPTVRLERPEESPPARPAVVNAPSPRIRRLLVAVAVALGVALVAWLAISFAAPLWPAGDSAGTIEYPAVEGELGTHLEQLQRSVEP